MAIINKPPINNTNDMAENLIKKIKQGKWFKFIFEFLSFAAVLVLLAGLIFYAPSCYCSIVAA